MSLFQAELANCNDHLNAGLPLQFTISEFSDTEQEFKYTGYKVGVDHDENSSPMYSGDLITDGSLIKLHLAFVREFESYFDVEDDNTYDFLFDTEE